MYNLSVTLIFFTTSTSSDQVNSLVSAFVSQSSKIVEKLPIGFNATISASLMIIECIVLRLFLKISLNRKKLTIKNTL